MPVAASEDRKALFPLIKKVNDDHGAVEIVSKRGNAVLASAEDSYALSSRCAFAGERSRYEPSRSAA